MKLFESKKEVSNEKLNCLAKGPENLNSEILEKIKDLKKRGGSEHIWNFPTTLPPIKKRPRPLWSTW
jgi:hypothetical protein